MKQLPFHILFWIGIIYWRGNADVCCCQPLSKFYLYNALRLPIMMLSTYVLVFYFLPKYVIQKKEYWTFAILFALNFWAATTLDRMLLQSDWMMDMLNPTAEQFKIFKQIHPYRNSFIFFSIMGLACMISFFKLYLEGEKHRHELEEEHLATKLAFLKTQVNPHFLFNALNNIYSIAIQKEQTEIALGLENLSGIMQYLTYDSSGQKVALQKEIELLNNYMDIQHLRFAKTDDITTSFQVEGDISNKMIAPVILLPLVENAFKHGIKLEQKSLVSIKLSVKESTLNFKIKNSFFNENRPGIEEKGIGLENVKKRLRLLYPNQHQLHFQQTSAFFFSELQIDI